MTSETAPEAQRRIRLERTYEAAVEDLWELWTTKEGFESWWGPEGFRVEVRALELRVGGALLYDMIACGAEQIAFMEQSGQPVSHETRGTFVDIRPLERLEISHMIDFIPGVEPYENRMCMELFSEGTSVRMVITVDPHRDPHWTRMATMGMESQLSKVPGVLARRG